MISDTFKVVIRQLIPHKKNLNKEIQIFLYNRALVAKIVRIFSFSATYLLTSTHIGLNDERCTEVL